VDVASFAALDGEWKTYGWGPAASRGEVPGLLDTEGSLWPDVPTVAKRAKAAEIEKEIRAQNRTGE